MKKIASRKRIDSRLVCISKQTGVESSKHKQKIDWKRQRKKSLRGRHSHFMVKKCVSPGYQETYKETAKRDT